MAQRITDRNALNALRDKARDEIDLRTGEKELMVTVHMGTCGIAAGARDILSQLMSELAKVGISTVSVRQSGCAGLCDQEPMMTLTDKNGAVFRYGKLTHAKVHEIVEGHLVGGNPVTRYLVQV